MKTKTKVQIFNKSERERIENFKLDTKTGVIEDESVKIRLVYAQEYREELEKQLSELVIKNKKFNYNTIYNIVLNTILKDYKPLFYKPDNNSKINKNNTLTSVKREELYYYSSGCSLSEWEGYQEVLFVVNKNKTIHDYVIAIRTENWKYACDKIKSIKNKIYSFNMSPQEIKSDINCLIEDTCTRIIDDGIRRYYNTIYIKLNTPWDENDTDNNYIKNTRYGQLVVVPENFSALKKF